MMETARTSETLVNFYQTKRRYNPEDIHLRKRFCLQNKGKKQTNKLKNEQAQRFSCVGKSKEIKLQKNYFRFLELRNLYPT
jgi:hypothetical protein